MREAFILLHTMLTERVSQKRVRVFSLEAGGSGLCVNIKYFIQHRANCVYIGGKDTFLVNCFCCFREELGL